MTYRPLLLLVEDEPIISFALEEMLERGGFVVVTSSSGEAAILLLVEPERDFVALITDIRLGDGMDGWTLARYAREFDPGICVVYVTADSAVDWAVQGVPQSSLLQKPVVDAQLLTAVSTLLNERGPRP